MIYPAGRHRSLRIQQLERRQLLAVTFSIGDGQAIESGPVTGPAGDTGAVGFSVQATSDLPEGSASETASISYAVFPYTNPSALGDVDFTPVSGTLTFSVSPLSPSRKSVLVPLPNDTESEGTERFLILLHSPSFGATISDGAGVGRIIDNDQPRYPNAYDDPFTVPLASANNPLFVLVNDVDLNGDVLTITNLYGVSSTEDGFVTNVGSHLLFTPAPSRTEPFTAKFTYIATDSTGRSDPGDVVIRVGGMGNTNPPVAGPQRPNAKDDFASTRSNVPITLDVLVNDNFTESGATQVPPPDFIDGYTQPQHGEIEVVGNTFVYRPDPGFIGTDFFAYAAGTNGGGVYTAARVNIEVRGYVALPTMLPYLGADDVIEMLDYNADAHQDLVRINKAGLTNTEVQILSGAFANGGRFRQDLVNLPTVFLRTAVPGLRWDFRLADWNHDQYFDLVGIYSGGTGSGKTEIHVAAGGPGASNFQTFAAHIATAFPQAGSEVEFEVLDWNRDGATDIVAIKKDGASGRTELHVLNGASGLQSFIQQTATVFLNTGDAWSFEISDWNGDLAYDLVGIKRFGGGSHTTELHVANGAQGLQSFWLQTGTDLEETSESFAYKVLDFDDQAPKDLIAIWKEGGASGKAEVLFPSTEPLISFVKSGVIDNPTSLLPPHAVDDPATVYGGGSNSAIVTVLSNDSDGNGDLLFVRGVSQPPQNGYVTPSGAYN